MTRATIFRILVAIRLLPNFTAYWWMLPRRMKRCRTFAQAMMMMMSEYQRKQWEKTFERALTFRADALMIGPIGQRDFRIPISYGELKWK